MMFPFFGGGFSLVYGPGFAVWREGEAALEVMSFSLNFLLVAIHCRKCHFIYKHKV